MPRGVYDRTTAKPRPLKSYPRELVERVRELYEAGQSVNAVAAATGTDYKTVKRVMARNGIKERNPNAIPNRCRSGRHDLTPDNLIFLIDGVWTCRACRRLSEAAYRRRRFTRLHGDHDVIATATGPYCRTCVRGDHDIDEIAIERAVAGDGPERLRIAEREAAIVQLRSYGLPYRLIAERVGCTLRTAWWTCSRLGVTEVAVARAWVEQFHTSQDIAEEVA